LEIRELSDGRYAVIDGYGWGLEFARFENRACAVALLAAATLSADPMTLSPPLLRQYVTRAVSMAWRWLWHHGRPGA
jgi:hypothetical protein